jgi:hypothetical protein
MQELNDKFHGRFVVVVEAYPKVAGFGVNLAH